MQDAYITVSAAAEELGMSTSGVHKLIERGKLPAVRLNKHGLRVSRLALDAYRRRLQRGSTPVPIGYVDATLDELRAEFESETKLWQDPPPHGAGRRC
jgi:excisionase family DNA binding protein